MRGFAAKSILLIMTLTGVLPCTAEIPHLINYQGILTNADGVPIDGTHDLTFSIYENSTTETALWTEVHTAVSVADGLFNVILGGVSSFPEDLYEGAERWMGITVDTDEEISPRMRLTSVPWALRAAVADTALTGVGGGGDGHSLDAVDGDPVDVVFVDENGLVGIGTIDPWYPLHIHKDSPAPGLFIESQAELTWFRELDQTGPGSLWRIALGSKKLVFDASESENDFSSYERILTLRDDGTSRALIRHGIGIYGDAVNFHEIKHNDTTGWLDIDPIGDNGTSFLCDIKVDGTA
ncbi:MAG: hypothetical protein PHQ53_00085 [Candidatus Krumholzibacteria bacterium]|nr:hypothetical protein [Candidatus Krumholzibacteria bacterium]